MVIREDDSLGLFIGESERGKIRRKDMSPMGDKVGLERASLARIPLNRCVQTSKYIAGCFFSDTTGVFKTKAAADGSAADPNVTSTLQSAMNAGTKTQWLLLCRPQGVLEVRHATGLYTARS